MNTKSNTTKWWTSFISPTMLLAILAGFGSLVVFWNNANNTSKDVSVIKDQLINKADLKITDAAADRIQRIYEQMNKMSDRISTLEKQQEYQRGVDDGIRKTIK